VGEGHVKNVTIVQLVIKQSKEDLLPPCRRQEGEELQLLLILDLGTRWGVWSASRPGRALPPGNASRYSLYRRLVGPQSWSGRRGRIICLCWGPNSGRPVCSQTL
jgi:hypothetical protein